MGNPSRLAKLFLLGSVLVGCLVILERYQLANHFSVLPGDRYDAVIVATILDHWFHVFSGNASWSQVSYFFPYTKTIAQTDAYFLVGVFYYPFRVSGLDPFLSIELTSLVIKSVGFVGAYLLCRKVFSLSFCWALLVAVLFTISNGMTIHSQRLQLATVAFTPTMSLLVWFTIKAFIDGNFSRFRMFGLVSGILFGAWCLTCFYMAWFFAFFMSALAATILVAGGRQGLLQIKDKLSFTHYGSVLFVLISTLTATSPFISAFLPKSREVGVRSYRVSIFQIQFLLRGFCKLATTTSYMVDSIIIFCPT